MSSADAATDGYQCPGEPYSISWSVHLGRLATHFSKCRLCPHRDATGTLSARQVKRLTETRASTTNPQGPPVDCFVLNGADLSSADAARRLALAAGVYFRRLRRDAAQPAVVVLGSTGQGYVAELVGPIGDGLRLAGCDLVDVGSVTSACLVSAVDHLGTDGGIIVSGAEDDPKSVSVSLWGKHARPLSDDAGLNEVRELWHQGAPRPTRRAGNRRRWQADGTYLSTLRHEFHSLRPLRFVLHTMCSPLVHYWKRLATQVGCEVIDNGRSRPMTQAVAAIGVEVQRQRAHFGVWIDHTGESCRLIDEQGNLVPPERFLLLMAGQLLLGQPDGVIVLEHDTPERVGEAILDAGADVVASRSAKAEMSECMRDRRAIFGGGPSGRYWFRAPYPVADGLRALSLLLTILSGNDAPLSSALEGSLQARLERR